MDVDLPKNRTEVQPPPSAQRTQPSGAPPEGGNRGRAAQTQATGLIPPATINSYKKKFNWIQYLPSQRFRVLFTLFSECCLTFPTRYFFAIGLPVNI